jgi:glucose/arabinose dehydrogenase
MSARSPAILALSLVFSLLTLTTQAASLPAGFTETRVATGLTSATAMAVAPDGRVFVAQQGGALRVVRDGELLSQPFLTVSVNASGERGLLGVAFDPNFATNRYVYVYYTTASSPIHNRLSRFTASASNPDVVAAGSEVQLLNLPALGATNHNGGAIHFGTDGKLYVAVGDNAVRDNAPSLSSPLGKILRINPDGSIPSDNPFFSQTTGINRAIWARGLRNPFTFGVDRTNGRIHVNDVGEDAWEEVNRGVAGANYGWPQTEGPNPPGVSGVTYPLYSFQHPSGCSVTGGAFYRPVTANFPAEYAGRYFFGDYCGGFIRTLAPPGYSSAAGFATGISSLVDIQVHQDGSLYYLARGNGGELYRVTHTSMTAPSITSHPSSITVNAGATASFSVTASGSGPLRYQWQRNGANISGANAATYSFIASTADNNAQFRVLVSNSAGSALSNSATLTVNSTVVFSDNFEQSSGWALTPGRNWATTGRWQRGDPQPTSYAGLTIQQGSCGDGSINCLITGLAAGSVVNANDVDNGLTSIQSPLITLPATGNFMLSFDIYLGHLRNATSADFIVVRVVGNDDIARTVYARAATANNVAGTWGSRNADISAWRGQTVRLRVEVVDNDPNGVVEAGFDNVIIRRQ